MRFTKPIFLSLCIAVCFSCKKTPSSPEELAIQKAQEFIDSKNIAGLAIAVGQGDALVWSKGFGYADVAKQKKVDPATTRFRIGSISKTLTASAMMHLYEAGKLDLHADARSYIPSFPKKKHIFTVGQLAGHLGGIRHYRGDEFMITQNYTSQEDALPIFWEDTLLSQPGTQYRYSSYGWNLLGVIVEKAAGTPYLDVMRSLVIERLGMHHTLEDIADSLITDRTHFYLINEDTIQVEAPYVNNSYKWASGGYISTVEDLIKFGIAHRKEGLFKAETLHTFTESQSTSDGKPTNYGYGWRSGEDSFGRQWYGHTGGSVGGVSIFRIYPGAGLTIALTHNTSSMVEDYFGNEYTLLADEIADVFTPKI